MISWVTMQDKRLREGKGEYMRISDAKDFTRFCDGYFRGLQLHGVYLTDIVFDDLTEEAKDSFFEEAYNLWISHRGAVETVV